MKRVALLRGINVSGRNKIPMKELRTVCEGLGWTSVATLLQTGNVLFDASGRKAAFEKDLEEAIASEFGVSVPVIVRDAKAIGGYLKTCPLRSEAERDPARTILYVTKRPVAPSAQELLDARAVSGERTRVQRDSLWIHFAEGVASSKLSPAIIDKAVGSPATGRNWNTMSKIHDLMSRRIRESH